MTSRPRVTSVRKVVRFCEPVDVNGQGTLDATAHLTCYRISGDGFAGPTKVGFDNELLSAAVQVPKPATLCVPSQRDGIPSALNLNHFKGYDVKHLGVPPFGLTVTGALGSQFAKFLQDDSLLTPVNQDGSGVVDPSAHLTCFRFKYLMRGVKIPKPSFTKRTVVVQNVFGTQALKLSKPEALCLPALRTFSFP